jgi:pimeloyl-ACP methyl ester carboxylesterase
MSLARITGCCLTLLVVGSLCSDALCVHGAPPPWQYRGEMGVIFVAPGAGAGLDIVDNMRESIAKVHLPLYVAAVPWNHQPSAAIADVKDQENHQIQGYKLARRILFYRQINPGGKIYLVAHSAGGAVLLAATQHLPPNSIDRIVLLAPAETTCYDLRQALKVCRHGIDVYYSSNDKTLHLLMNLVGSTEGDQGPAAGQVGFKRYAESPEDALLYRKLRQFPWCQEYGQWGYHGGHLGVTRESFMTHCIVPRMLME